MEWKFLERLELIKSTIDGEDTKTKKANNEDIAEQERTGIDRIVFFLLGHMVINPWGRPGGIGMATTMGAGIVLLPMGALIAVIPSFLILVITRRPSYTGVFAFISTVIAGWLVHLDLIATISVLILAGAVLIKFQFQYRDLETNK